MGLFGQTTGPEFSANGAAYGLAYSIQLAHHSKIRLEHTGADLRGQSFLVTDMDGNTIGKGRQAFYKLQFNTLYQRSIWSNEGKVDVYAAIGPGISYVYENTFSEINNTDIDGPVNKEFALAANLEIGLELSEFIFSLQFAKSYYSESIEIIDSNNWYIGLGTGYQF